MDIEDIAEGDEISECIACSLENKDEQDITKELIQNMNVSKNKFNNKLLDW